MRVHLRGDLYQGYEIPMPSPYLNIPPRSYAEARRDGILARLQDAQGRLRQLRLDDPRRGKIAMEIRALEAELDGFDDTVAT